MAAYLIRRLWQMVPDAGRRGAAGVRAVQVLRRRPGRDPGRPERHARADRRDPPAARAGPALVGPAGHLRQADRHLRLGQELGHQRVGGQPVRHPAAGDADGDDADPGARHAAGDPDRDVGGLPARLADRPRDHGRHHRGAVDQFPRLHHRRPVPVRLPARLVPGAGLERQRLDQPDHLRAAAGAAGGDGRRWRRRRGCTAASSSTSSARTTCAPRAPRA